MQASTDRTCNAKGYLAPLFALLLCLAGCQESAEVGTAQNSPAQAATGTADLPPPSFLDPAPTAPQSATIILSGGTLVQAADSQEQDLFDAVVVISDGKVVATGKRGSVPVPADSVGIDTSGKFIVAVPSKESTLPANANFIIYHERPSPGIAATVFARVTDGAWVLVDPPAEP